MVWLAKKSAKVVKGAGPRAGTAALAVVVVGAAGARTMPGAAKKTLPIITFASQQKFRAWLTKNCTRTDGIWLQFFKKNSGVKTVVYAEALDEALCYGWIDAQTKSYDELSYLQRFTPRRAKSIWSKKNTGHVERLIKAGKMTAAGLEKIDAAKADGRWEQAYDSPSEAKLPQDFLEKLCKNLKALAFYNSLNSANKYAIIWRIQTAKKPETRLKRVALILEMLKNGEKFHN